MSVYFQQVRFTPGLSWVCLREISGHEEQHIHGTGPLAVTQLLDRLLVDMPPHAPKPANLAQQLSLADRDRILAGIYSRVYGSKIDTTLNCENCGEPFDMDFTLDQLLAHVDQEAVSHPIDWQEDGSFEVHEGLHLRLPNGADEWAIWSVDPTEAEQILQKRCVVKGNTADQQPLIEETLEKTAPMLSMDMKAICPECGHEMHIRFDMQSYLMQALKMDQPLLARQVHRIAMHYSWSQTEILTLPRSLRRTYAQMIEAEKSMVYA